jgi:hypothetical protein
MHPGALSQAVGKNTNKADAVVLALYAEQYFNKGK